LELSNIVKSLENRLDLGIGYIEEICFNKGWVKRSSLIKIIKKYENSDYGQYLKKIK
jgi:dTDP-glucose pyrophosphorylase